MNKYNYYCFLWLVLAIAALILEVVKEHDMGSEFMGSLILCILYRLAGDFRDQLKMKGE